MSEQETGLFWRITTELRRAQRAGNAVAVRESLDEIDLMRELTESDSLRQRCGEILAEAPIGAVRQ